VTQKAARSDRTRKPSGQRAEIHTKRTSEPSNSDNTLFEIPGVVSDLDIPGLLMWWDTLTGYVPREDDAGEAQ
jgi:hypothetical protein